MAEPSEGLVLELRHVVPGSPAAVFAALSDAAEVAQWWGPHGFRVASLDFEPRVGRSYRIRMQPPSGDAFELGGEFREVAPPNRLAYTFAYETPDPDDVETLVLLSLRDLDGSTEVSLRQAPFSTEERRTLHLDGWTDSLQKLERQLSAGS